MKVVTETKYILELNICEAEWLRNNVQNPLFGESRDEEDKDQKEMRRKLWEALNSAIHY